MSITTVQFLEGLYVAYWGRAADPVGLQYWEDKVEILGFAEIGENFAASQEGKESYAFFQTYYDLGASAITVDMREAFVDEVFQNLFNNAPDSEGRAYWVGELESGATTPGAMIAHIINAAYEGREGNSTANWSAMFNKIQAAEGFTSLLTEEVVPWNEPLSDNVEAVLASVDGDSILADVMDDIAALVVDASENSLTYAIVDTGQDTCYDTTDAIDPPNQGEAFFGQDAQYSGLQPAYFDNGDGTITDFNTGLMWQQDYYENITAEEGIAVAESATIGGYEDWRMPTIKELYSLILFSGYNSTSAEGSTPFLNTDFFAFEYGNDNGYRDIDSQFMSDTHYVGTTMNGAETYFGVNFADGRIKGYPSTLERYVRLVRGNTAYGENEFVDNGDGTINDKATGLMWSQSDSAQTMTWEEALAWAESLELGGYDDWRLPNAKELQSILDYNYAADASSPDNVGPAIDDTFFDLTAFTTEDIQDYGYHWTSTTHQQGTTSMWAAYVAFGPAWGYVVDPVTGEYILTDVHGAGAQRSDPKAGDPGAYPNGFGPQNDLIRINNYAIAVRDADSSAQAAETTSLPAQYIGVETESGILEMIAGA